MNEREELEGLRRLAELEAKAKGSEAPQFDDPGFMQSVMIAGGKSTKRLMQGAQQLYYGAKSNFEKPDLTSLITGKNASQRKLDELAAEVEEEDRLYKPLAEARPWATGIGEALPSLAIPVGGGVGLLGKAGRAAIAGAAPGLLEYGSAEDRLKKGAIGATAGALLPVGAAAFRTGKALVEPLYEGGRRTIAGRTLNRAAGDSADAVANRMSQASQLVPGSAPTAAQVAESGGIAALQRSAAAANPEAFTQRAMEQSSARLNALRGVAGDDMQMAQAVAKRASDKAADYSTADMGVAPLDGMFSGLLQRPQFAAAVARAQTLAKDSGLQDIFFRGNNGEPVALIGQGAHFIKKALDEAAEFGSTSYTGKMSASSAGNTNDLFRSWLDKSIPEYRKAGERFAANSRPINQMQVGGDLLNAVQPALADYGALGSEQVATYARALRNADATAAKATGMSGARMADVMTPQQMGSIEGVAQDLARKTNAQNLGRGVGSDTFQKLSMQNIAEQSGMPRMTAGLLGLPGVSRATSWAYRDTDQKVQNLLAELMLNPQRAAEVMRKAKGGLLSQKQSQLLEDAATRMGLLAAPAAQGLVSQ